MALRDKIGLIFSIKDTPHRLSLAFSLGVFIGMSPLFGIHTILGIAVSVLFRLNRLATLVGVYITNPWTIIPIYTFSTWVGAQCLGISRIVPEVNWNQVTFSMLLTELKPLLMPFIVGTLLIGVLSSVLSYGVVYYIVKKKNG